MEIIEHFSKGKRPDRPCEDGWVATDDFAAVVDGSTAKIKIDPAQESPGHLAMRLVCSAIRQFPADLCKEEALTVLTQVIAEDKTYASKHYRPTCSAVVYSRHRREVWFIGDCQCRCGGETHKHDKVVDKILTDIRCDVIRYYLAHGYTEEELQQDDKGRAFIYDALCDQLYFQNDSDSYNPYRYPVIDGQTIDASLVPSMSVGNSREIILASDGYPILLDTLDETERKLQEVLEKDPLCIQENPSTKCLVEGNDSFDDRTFLRLRL